MSSSPVTVSVADLVPLGRLLDDSVPESRETPQVRAWLDAARAGDAAAFGELVGLYQRVVFRTALAALGDREDAEDVSQDAFVLAWRKLPNFRGDAMFRTWLLTIVWRRAIDRRRARRLAWFRRPAATADDGTFDPLDALAAPDADPERAAVAVDLARRTRRIIGELSPTLRDTLLLAASGEHSYDDIGRLLGAPVGTIKWRVSEARRQVAARLEATGQAAISHDRT